MEPLPLPFLARLHPVVAVIHTGPSPGIGGNRSVRCAVGRAAAEARLLVELGVDALLVENAFDAPMVAESAMGPEVAAFMTRVASAVKAEAGRVPVGVRVLDGANRTALAVALAAGCDFVRAHRWAQDPAGPGALGRYRRALGAEGLPILADLRPQTADDLPDLVAHAEQAGANGVVLLGRSPGLAPDPGLAEALAEASALPFLLSGGLAAENVEAYLDLAGGFVVGGGLKEGGRWQAPVCERRVRALVGALEYARGQEVRQ